MHRRPLAIIGLDCAEPSLVFGRFKHRLPNLSHLAAAGAWGKLRSCDPPITIPAWMCMMTGKDAGTLGFTGFRNRSDRSYDKLTIASFASVKEPLLWDRLGQAGMKSILLGVPQTFPPRPVNGMLVSGFPTPGADSDYTFPPELKNEIRSVVGEYLVDVPNFRTDDKERLKTSLWTMTEKRFALARHLARTRPWDFFMMVEMGPDRLHHGFWKSSDPMHPKHVVGNPWERVMEDYYAFLDDQIGRLLAEFPAETTAMILSDHGATALLGGICINEWLIQKGYLVLKEYPTRPCGFERLKVDWPKTRAWGEGGYYARIALNVQGREPQGALPPAETETFRDRLAAELEALPGPDGRPLGTRALRPETIYRTVRGIAPDLMVYFGNLRWRSIGQVGTGSIYAAENDTGPDDANHAFDGIFVGNGPDFPVSGEQTGLSLFDIAPTVLRHFGLPLPDDLAGHPIGAAKP